MRNAALLGARLLLGSYMGIHASQKLLGKFHGPGLDGIGAVFEKNGLAPGRQMAMAAAATEIAGGILTITGIADPAGPLAQQVVVVDDGGGADGVACEHTGGGAARRADEQGDVEGAAALESGVGGGGGEALWRSDRAVGDRYQGGGHGRFKIRRENACVTVRRFLS